MPKKQSVISHLLKVCFWECMTSKPESLEMGGGHCLPSMLINGNQIDLVCSEPEGKVKCYFKYLNHLKAILF